MTIENDVKEQQECGVILISIWANVIAIKLVSGRKNLSQNLVVLSMKMLVKHRMDVLES